MSWYIPRYYLPLEDLAKARGIEFAKLNKGLGLLEMAVPAANEDAATFAASAVLKLIETNNIDPRSIGRIYLGTESAVDSAKPTASYVLEMLEKRLESTYGFRSLKHCDVVDLTFACIGAVDAMQNCIDWARAGQGRVAIVVASDAAKYELGSTGEYTQGAGAVALLIKEEPRMLVFEEGVGVATESVGDFFKPRRSFDKGALLREAARMLGTELSASDADHLLDTTDDAFWGTKNREIDQFVEMPVFDGPYSNACYQNRISEALGHLSNQRGGLSVLDEWDYLCFHLPYAYQGRRMIVDNYSEWMEEKGRKKELSAAISDDWGASPSQIKALSKTDLYQSFVNDRIASGERASSRIGNMYTASIFMSLISLLTYDTKLESGKRIGFFAYGSGSKSKVFSAVIAVGFEKGLCGNIEDDLNARIPIGIEEYELLHRGGRILDSDGFTLVGKGEGETNQGLRFYGA